MHYASECQSEGEGVAAMASIHFHLVSYLESFFQKIQNSVWKSSASKWISQKAEKCAMQDLNKLPSRYFGAPIHYAHYVNGGKGGCSQRAQGAIIFKRWLSSLPTGLTMEKRERGGLSNKRGSFLLLCQNSFPANKALLSKTMNAP